jgi:MFS family permease
LASTSSPLKAVQVAADMATPTRVRWNIVALVAFVTGLTYVDRLNLGIVAKNFQEEFNFTAQSMGWILGAFSLGYAWFHLPGGWLADRFGARRVLAGAIIWFSAFTALTTIAPRLPILNLLGAAWAFAIVRFLMGLGESAAFPVGNKMMGYWLGPSERAFGTSIFLSGVGVAGIIAPVVITRIATDFGWRSPFLVLGLIGILAAIACYFYVTDRPEQNPHVNASELALIAGHTGTEVKPKQGQISQKIDVPWGTVFSTPSIWALMVSHFCLVYPLYIFFYLVFYLLGESPRRYSFKCELLGVRAICRQYHHGALLGMVFGSPSSKAGEAEWPPDGCMVGYCGLGSIAVVRESYLKQYRGTSAAGDCGGIQFCRVGNSLHYVHRHIQKILRFNFWDHGYFRQPRGRGIAGGNRPDRNQTGLERRIGFRRGGYSDQWLRLVLH